MVEVNTSELWTDLKLWVCPSVPCCTCLLNKNPAPRLDLPSLHRLFVIKSLGPQYHTTTLISISDLTHSYALINIISLMCYVLLPLVLLVVNLASVWVWWC